VQSVKKETLAARGSQAGKGGEGKAKLLFLKHDLLTGSQVWLLLWSGLRSCPPKAVRTAAGSSARHIQVLEGHAETQKMQQQKKAFVRM